MKKSVRFLINVTLFQEKEDFLEDFLEQVFL